MASNIIAKSSNLHIIRPVIAARNVNKKSNKMNFAFQIFNDVIYFATQLTRLESPPNFGALRDFVF